MIENKQTNNLEKRIRVVLHTMFRLHDLSSNTFSDSIDGIVSVCLKEIKKTPGLGESLQEDKALCFFIEQIILETWHI